MKSTKSFIKYNTLIRVISAIVAAVLIIDFLPCISDKGGEITAEAALDLTSFEKTRWNAILGDTFNGYTVTGNVTPTNPSTMFSNENIYTVKDDSPYFQWHKSDNEISQWQGLTEVESNVKTITYDKDTVLNGVNGNSITAGEVEVKYDTYCVSNADEFVWVMTKKAQSGSNIRIELLKDIDMGGSLGKNWNYTINLNGNSWFDLEGNGHIIYNFRMNNPLIKSSSSNKKTIIRNVLFSNCLAFFNAEQQSVVIGSIISPVYLENVSVTDSFLHTNQSNIGILIGRVNNYGGGNVFLKNCSTLRSYIYGDSHIGGLTACQFNIGNNYQVKYDEAFPKSPEAWMNYGNRVFPEMIENCYSVDCEVFSSGEDSGAFISCGDGFICRNCFTNNKMYGNRKTGAFIGRVVTSSHVQAGLIDDGNRYTLNASFINCFSSGSVEGNSKIGGFTAFQDSSSSPSAGACIYRNCYSTAMVGMEYAGSQLGGFVGHENTYKIEKQHPNIILPDGTISDNYGDMYINCYAAGEVGNILTDTSVTATGNALGGFLGDVETSGNGTYYNCYYDKQTTAMRERACGQKNEFTSAGDSQIPGVVGVYTMASEAKAVKGLADTINIMDSNIGNDSQSNEWVYLSGFYPMLKAFCNNEIFNTSFDEKRKELVEAYARASVSTVLLNHYDAILDENGLEREATASEEDKKIYDTVRDITSKFELTTDDEKGITWGKDVEMNETRNLTDKFGGEDGFTLSYVTVNQNENGEYLNGSENESIVTKKFTPNVLTIGRYDDPEDDRGYYYKCFDFAPGIQWLKVSAGEVQSDTTERLEEPQYKEGAIIGSRSFRLLPTAYLNAGDIMHINVITDNTSENVVYSNTVTISEGGNENQINGLFNHSVGTAFAITDRFRMGTDIYSGQNQKILLYNGNNGNKLTDNSTFAFYAGYSVNDANSGNAIDDVVNSKKIGANSMVSQKFDITNNANVTSNLVSLNGVTNNSSDGMVRVRVFRAQPKKIGNSNDFYLERGDEIDYSDKKTLAKWQGEKPFDTNDSNAYYYLDYYWRLNDGRYLFDRKLVRITADTYSVTMKTGILDEEFTVNENSTPNTPKTVVDQYVTDNITTNPDQTKTWYKDELYPSKKAEFSAESASEFYDSYNNKEHINGNDYYTKTLKIDTSSPQTAIGWLRESDYKLTALIVEAVDGTGTRHEMSRIDTNNVAEPLNFDNAEYTYDYKTYSVTQNSETKIFSVVENQTVTNTFNVESHSSSMTNSISKFILFSFSTKGDVSQGGFSTINDDLIITALFRKNDANVKTEKQVLANMDNDDNPVKKVRDTINSQKYTDKNGNEVMQKYYSSLDIIDKDKRVDDTGVSDNKNRKAVLGGDTLTYRLKVYNTGYFTSKDVNVYDVIPEGTEYVDGSVKLYRQKLLSTSNFDRYKELEDLTAENNGFDITYEASEKAIKATLPKAALDENYYIEYKVKVNDIKATELKETITNQADYKFINFNGDTTEDFNDKNTNTAQENAIVSMDASHDENTYIVTFKGETGKMHQGKDYSLDSYYNEFSEQFIYDETRGIRLIKVSETDEDITDKVNIEIINDTNGKTIGFEIKNKDGEEKEIDLNSGNMYQVEFKGTAPPLTDSSGEIRNKATVFYKEDGEPKATAISIVERMTNQTETDVTHLYLSIVKEISEDDPSQTFLFKIERFDDDKLSGTPDISYARINCTEKKQVENMDSDCYIGNSLLQVDKRGYYRITEIDDWDSSDYVFENISVTDMTKITGWSNLDIKSINVESKNAIIRLPRQSDVATLTFPTAYGTFSSGSTAVLYPVVKFTDKPNEYAYRTSQAFAENKIS